jgi:hypothetical protein
MGQPTGFDEESPFEERPLVQEAIENDTTAPGLDIPRHRRQEPDPDTAWFQEPGGPPMTLDR